MDTLDTAKQNIMLQIVRLCQESKEKLIIFSERHYALKATENAFQEVGCASRSPQSCACLCLQHLACDQSHCNLKPVLFPQVFCSCSVPAFPFSVWK